MRLLDFGLAQMDEFDTLTAVGDVPGTLTYVSPERLRGETATAAADVWAVGVMLWEALAGRHPFRSSNAAGTSRRIQAGAPPLETVRPDLPAALLDAVASALDPDPEQRPAAAQARHRAPRRAAEAARHPGPGRAASRPPSPAGSHARRSRRSVWPRPSPPLPGRAGSPSALPFYPAGWPLGLTIAAAALGLRLPARRASRSRSR